MHVPRGLRDRGVSQGGGDGKIDMPSDMHQIDHHAAVERKGKQR